MERETRAFMSKSPSPSKILVSLLVPAGFLSVVACASEPGDSGGEENLTQRTSVIDDQEITSDVSKLGLRDADVLAKAKSFTPHRLTAADGDACSIALAAGGVATLSAAIMEGSAAATVGCAGVTAVTVAGELVCLLPAAGTALAGLTTAVASVTAGAATLVCTGELAGIKIRKIADDLAGTITSIPIGCSPGDYLLRTAAKYYWCKMQSPSSCRAGMSCSEVASRMVIANGCMVARLVHNACFPGNGDSGHKQALRDAIANVNACNAAAASCR